MALQLTRAAAAAVRRGHPWVYREGIVRAPPALASGAVVEVGADGRFLAQGLWDADSPIAVRIYEHVRDPRLDERTLLARIERALALRDELFADRTDTDAYRFCNGEGDRVPGLVIDRYAEAAVVRLDGGLLEPWLERLVQPIAAALRARGVKSVGLRTSTPPPAGVKSRSLAGEPLPERAVVREHGMVMEVDLWHGQKTGAFLDQRENRLRVRRMASGRGRVLNLFSYAGGFSIAAAMGGAREVTSVDSAAAAHATAQRSFRANGLDPAAHRFVTADAFAFLEQAAGRGERFELIISDPPSFAPSERARARGLVAYRRLHAAAAALLADRGILCAASCSSHVTAEDFLTTLDDATLGRDDLELLELVGQPVDHPSLPAFPEGRYLKLAVLG